MKKSELKSLFVSRGIAPVKVETLKSGKVAGIPKLSIKNGKDRICMIRATENGERFVFAPGLKGKKFANEEYRGLPLSKASLSKVASLYKAAH